MKVPRMAAAMGHIDDDLLLKSTEYQIPTIQIVMLWVRNTVGFCICLALTITLYKYTIYPLFHYPSQDPWWERHIYETSDLSEIESVCGTDLLLEKMAQSEGCTANYHLELVDVNGSFDNREDWKYLFIEVKNRDSVFDANWDYFSCYVSFDGSVYESALTEFAPTVWDGSAESQIAMIDGYSVEYVEVCSEESAELEAEYTPYGGSYHGWAKFVHQGYTYYITVHSNDPQYLETVLEGLLSE